MHSVLTVVAPRLASQLTRSRSSVAESQRGAAMQTQVERRARPEWIACAEVAGERRTARAGSAPAANIPALARRARPCNGRASLPRMRGLTAGELQEVPTGVRAPDW